MLNKGTDSVKISRCDIQISLLLDDYEDLSESNSDGSSLEGGNDNSSFSAKQTNFNITFDK